MLERSFPLGDVLELLSELWSLDHAFERTSKRMETELGITSPQSIALRIIGRYPGILAGQLARLLHVDASTVSAILGRLVQRGLVERRVDPRDRRRVSLGLTAEGRALDTLHAQSIEASVARALAQTSASDVEATRRVLATLREELTRTSASRG